MYTLLKAARIFYEIRQVKRNHPVCSGVSLIFFICIKVMEYPQTHTQKLNLNQKKMIFSATPFP